MPDNGRVRHPNPLEFEKSRLAQNGNVWLILEFQSGWTRSRGSALSQKSSNSLHKYEVAMQIAWLDALDQERAGAVQRDQRAAA